MGAVRWAHSHCTLQSRLVSCRPQIHWVERVSQASQTIHPCIHRYVDNARNSRASYHSKHTNQTCHVSTTPTFPPPAQSIEKEIVSYVVVVVPMCATMVHACISQRIYGMRDWYLTLGWIAIFPYDLTYCVNIALRLTWGDVLN